MKMIKNKTYELLSSLEGLALLGGFIKTYLEDLACEIYGRHFIDLISPYLPVGPGFCDAAASVRAAMLEVNEYSSLYRDLNSKYTPYSDVDKKFCDFVTSQIARLAAKRITDNEEMDFLMKSDIPPGKRAYINELNLLDIRILYLLSAKKLSAYEISKLPEFKCKEAYINTVLNKLDHKNEVNDSFDKEINNLFD